MALTGVERLPPRLVLYGSGDLGSMRESFSIALAPYNERAIVVRQWRGADLEPYRVQRGRLSWAHHWWSFRTGDGALAEAEDGDHIEIELLDDGAETWFGRMGDAACRDVAATLAERYGERLVTVQALSMPFGYATEAAGWAMIPHAHDKAPMCRHHGETHLLLDTVKDIVGKANVLGDAAVLTVRELDDPCGKVWV